MNNQIKSRTRATSQKEEKVMTSMLWPLKSVSQLVCVSQDSDALVSQGWKSRRNPMQKVLEPIQRVRFTKYPLRKTSIWEKTGPSLVKINKKVPHQRSPYAMKFEDRSDEETERQQRCVEARRGILPKTYTISQKKARVHATFPWRNGYSRLRQQKSRRKESL